MIMTILQQALIFAWLVASVLLCIRVRRLEPAQLRAAVHLCLPVLVLALPVLASRFFRWPANLEKWIFFSILIVFSLWQLISCRKHGRKAHVYDRTASWLSFLLMLAATVLSLTGHREFCLPVVLWWVILVALVSSLRVLLILMNHYYRNYVGHRVESEGKSIRITWFYDLLKMTVFPVLFVSLLPFSIVWASYLSGLDHLARTLILTPFIKLMTAQGEPALTVSMLMLLISVALFYVFRYLNYFIKSWYGVLKRARTGTDEEFTLANNLIAVLVWFLYAVVIVNLLNIPTGALAMVGTGLAAGVGLAMKDIINNAVYGIQLMSGRLKVGDWIVCDGMRGQVSAISYQSTQVRTIDGGLVSFLNADLFGKNFKNLTRGYAYEFVKIIFGVRYGTDVEKVRSVVQEALLPLQVRNENGMDVVDPARGVSVVFEEFADSSVNVAVKQFVLVHLKAVYTAQAQELIYNALNASGIEIPFPQRDIHIVTQE
ncbi:MAG: mechanosensitive ion channel [Bacteroidales bacterium]|nr:mechanosensitive ion channel [Bacteroidales bacterium]